MPSHRVFVYGSLLRGLHNHHLLHMAKLTRAPANTAAAEFVLVDSGSGYPFALAADRARASDARTPSVLLGEVYEVTMPAGMDCSCSMHGTASCMCGAFMYDVDL